MIIILSMIAAGFAIGIAVFLLLVMADGRRLRERMREPRPAFMPEEAEPETPLVTSRYAL